MQADDTSYSYLRNVLLMCDSVPNLSTKEESVVVPEWCPPLQNHTVTDYAALFVRFEKTPISCGFMWYAYETICDHMTVKISLQAIKNNLPKKHDIDTLCITGNPNIERLKYDYYQKQICRYNRQIGKYIKRKTKETESNILYSKRI